jgi:hypothetical protein
MPARNTRSRPLEPVLIKVLCLNEVNGDEFAGLGARLKLKEVDGRVLEF